MNLQELSLLIEELNFVKFHYSINKVDGDKFFIVNRHKIWEVGYLTSKAMKTSIIEVR